MSNTIPNSADLQLRISTTNNYQDKNFHAKSVQSPVRMGRINSSENLLWLDVVSIRFRAISSFQNSALVISIELHDFSDPSEKAYGACVYRFAFADRSK